MSVIYLGDGVRVKTYATKARAAGGAVISIEIEASAPSALGYLIHELEEIRAAQRSADKAAEEERRRAAKEAPRRTREKHKHPQREAFALEAASPPLLLSYREGDDHD